MSERNVNQNGALNSANTEKEPSVRDSNMQLQGIVSTLEQITNDSGSRFVDISLKLQSLYSKTEAMYQMTQGRNDLLSLTGGSSLLSGVGDTALSSLSNLRQSQADNQSLLQRVQETLAIIKRLLKSSESIAGMGGQLEIIGINLAIQTSRHRHGTETFGDFSSEIKGFSAYTRRFAEDIQQDAAEVGGILSEVKYQLESKLQYMAGFINRAEKNAGLTVQEIERLVARSIDSMSQKAIHSQNISKAVNEAIVAIQLDDITRQRMEHIRQAVKDVAYDDTPSGEGAIILKLQASQLSEVRVSINEAQKTIEAVFERIGEEIREIDAISYNDKEGGDVTTYSSLKTLHDTLLGLDSIHVEAEEIRRAIAESLDRAIESSGRISRHIGDVSIITQELNLKAINALLMSRDLGSEGNNLVVLAKELHSLSKESIDFVDDLKRAIEHVAQVTTSLKKNTLGQRKKDKEETLFAGKLDAINAAIVSLKETSTESHRLNEEISLASGKMSRELKGLTAIANRIETCHMQLCEIQQSITPSTLDEDTQDTVLEQIYHQYTMEEERKIHRGMSGIRETSPSGEGHPVDGGEQDNDEDELGNFELF